MKRKRGYVKRKPKTVPDVTDPAPEYCSEDIPPENAAMEVELPQPEINPAPGKVVVNGSTVNNVKLLSKTNITNLGNLSKHSGGMAVNPSSSSAHYSKFDCRVETETPRADILRDSCEAVLQNQAVNNGWMDPNSLREMIISVITDLSKNGGGLTTSAPSGLGHNSATNSDVPLFQPQVDKTQQEKADLIQDPQFKEQELKAALSVIKKIMKLDAAKPFSIPVDPIALSIPDYFDVIDTPMDFGTIYHNLENGLKYMNSSDVYKDVQYIWDNCCKYNKNGDYILELMQRVKKNFMKLWTAVGLYREPPQAIDGNLFIHEDSVNPVTFSVGPNHKQIHQPPLVRNKPYTPRQISHSPHQSQQMADVHTSSAGYSRFQPPTESTSRQKTHRQEKVVGTVTDQTDPKARQISQASYHSQQLADVHTSSAGIPRRSRFQTPTDSTWRHKMRRQETVVGTDTDQTDPKQVQPFPHHLSQVPHHSQQVADAHTSSAGCSRFQPPAESTSRHKTRRQETVLGAITGQTDPKQVHPYRTHQISQAPHQSQLVADVHTSSAGCSRFQSPTESTSRHRTVVGTLTNQTDPKQVQSRGQEWKMGPVSHDDRRQSQLHWPLSEDDEPHSSSDQSQLSLKEVDTNNLFAAPTEVMLMRGNRGKGLFTMPVSQNFDCQPDRETSNEEHPSQSSSDNTETNQVMPSSNPPQLAQFQVSSVLQKRRKGRGPTRYETIISTVGRIFVATNEVGHPVGDEASKLVRFLGILARDGNLLPLNYTSWKKVPEENKEEIWQEVLSKFDIGPISRSWIMTSVAARWRNFKANLKINHYDTHATDDERLADCDARVLPDQWAALVSQWSSEKWQNMSSRNKTNRSKQKFVHAAGSKSFARILEEEKSKALDGKEPSPADLFILTHTRKDGQPVNEATAAVIAKIRERERACENEESLIEDNGRRNDVFYEVMKDFNKDGKRVSGLGTASYLRSWKPSRIDAVRMVSEANAEVCEMKEKLVSMEQTCAQMAAQMSAMMAMMAAKEKSSLEKPASDAVAGNSDALGGTQQVQLPEQTTEPGQAVESRKTRGRKRR